jgi:hypothetical protein
MARRRRAPSSEVSRDKKLAGHEREQYYATIIGGRAIGGTQKGDVLDKNGCQHSVKSGKKWQIFLYGYPKISSNQNLKILQKCLDAFPDDKERYFADKEKCEKYKQNYIDTHDQASAKKLSNDIVARALGANVYIESKKRLSIATPDVRNYFRDKSNLRCFLNEALFSGKEVSFLAIKDDTNDGFFKVFEKEETLNILSERLFPELSKAGNDPRDFNVAAQKTLLCYSKEKGRSQNNLGEIEIRNDSNVHYRQVRFNMYSSKFFDLILTEKPKVKHHQLNCPIEEFEIPERGKVFHLDKEGWVKVFKIASKSGAIDYWATRDLERMQHLCEESWKIGHDRQVVENLKTYGKAADLLNL